MISLRSVGAARIALIVSVMAAYSSGVIAQVAPASPPNRRTADEVLVVSNSASPISKSISDFYAQARHVKNRLAI